MIDTILFIFVTVLLLIIILILIGFITIFCLFIYQWITEPILYLKYLKSIKRLTKDEVILKNEKIKQENEKYKSENPLNLEWLIYENGTPLITTYYKYIEWSCPVHWKLPKGMNLLNSLGGFYSRRRHLTSYEILQLAQGIHFPRSYTEAKELK